MRTSACHFSVLSMAPVPCPPHPPPTTTPQGQDSSNAITLYTGHLIRKDRNYYSQWEGKENEAQKVSVAAKGHAACVCRL